MESIARRVVKLAMPDGMQGRCPYDPTKGPGPLETRPLSCTIGKLAPPRRVQAPARYAEGMRAHHAQEHVGRVGPRIARDGANFALRGC